jgi:hypothetical protein
MAAVPRDDRAPFARNWLTILVVDALLGVVALVGGLLLTASGSTVIGAVLVLVGMAYVALIVRRGIRWRRLRADAGLS